jgi:hypothetical protein
MCITTYIHLSPPDCFTTINTRKIYSKSLPIKKIQIKIILRVHLTPFRMAIIKKIITNAGEDVWKKELIHCWWECKLVQPL